MELVERGILSAGDLDGLDLRFGNVEATTAMIERIALREGAGDLLADGAKRAAERVGGGAERYAMHVKGLEMVPFEPRSQGNLATGFAVASIGPRYDICEHDWDYDVEVGWPHAMELSRTLGIYERIPMEHLGIDKVRNYKALNTLWSAADALSFCVFAVAPTRVLTMAQMADLARRRYRLGDVVPRDHALWRAAQPHLQGLQQPRGAGAGGRHAAGPLLRRGHLGRTQEGTAPGSRHFPPGDRDLLSDDGLGRLPAYRCQPRSTTITWNGRWRDRERLRD